MWEAFKQLEPSSKTFLLLVGLYTLRVLLRWMLGTGEIARQIKNLSLELYRHNQHMEKLEAEREVAKWKE